MRVGASEAESQDLCRAINEANEEIRGGRSRMKKKKRSKRPNVIPQARLCLSAALSPARTACSQAARGKSSDGKVHNL